MRRMRKERTWRWRRRRRCSGRWASTFRLRGRARFVAPRFQARARGPAADSSVWCTPPGLPGQGPPPFAPSDRIVCPWLVRPRIDGSIHRECSRRDVKLKDRMFRLFTCAMIVGFLSLTWAAQPVAPAAKRPSKKLPRSRRTSSSNSSRKAFPAGRPHAPECDHMAQPSDGAHAPTAIARSRKLSPRRAIYGRKKSTAFGVHPRSTR